MSARTGDVTSWCEPRFSIWPSHKHCDGILHSATGYHWWCACHHHDPIPEPKPGTEAHKAWKVWKAAR
jgi:hypothetical protein